MLPPGRVVTDLSCQTLRFPTVNREGCGIIDRRRAHYLNNFHEQDDYQKQLKPFYLYDLYKMDETKKKEHAITILFNNGFHYVHNDGHYKVGEGCSL